MEGYRWQMVPLYGLTPLLALTVLIGLNQPRAGSFPSSALGSILTLILLAVSTALPILLPVPRCKADLQIYSTASLRRLKKYIH
jgi:hypothetical protein